MPDQIDPFEGAPDLPRIVGVSFIAVGHLYNFLAGDLALRRGDRVVVEGDAGVRKFRNWIRQAVETNLPYDQFVRILITATGDCYENPSANYLRVVRELTLQAAA